MLGKIFFWELKSKACDEAYEYFDKNIRKLPRDEKDKITETLEFADSDIDAFRHAYVSGRYTQEYNEIIARILGDLNEIGTFITPLYPENTGRLDRNMDLWNNAVGRKYAKKCRSGKKLGELLHKAMKDGELILSPKDLRVQPKIEKLPLNPEKPVVVVKEGETGRNELFYDTKTGELMTRIEFVKAIKKNAYPGYRVVKLYGKETPVSKKDGSTKNNLG